MLAPGGTLGRFIIWTQSAFKALDTVFGSYKKPSSEKHGYHLHRTVLGNADIAKIINSDAIQKVVKPAGHHARVHAIQKKNPLKNKKFMEYLNPYSKTVRDMEKKAHEDGKKKRQAALDAKRGISKSLTKEQKAAKKALKKSSTAWIKNVEKEINDNASRDIERDRIDHEAEL